MSQIKDAPIVRFMLHRPNQIFGKMIKNYTTSFLNLRFILLLWIGGWTSVAFSQTNSPNGQVEVVSYSIPKTIYFPGERIWIEAEVNLGQTPSPSQVLYAELIDAESNSADYVKIPLVGGKAFNFLKIKPTLPSANYLLRVYTRISPYLDLEKGIAQQFITIINPSIPPRNDERSVDSSLINQAPEVSFSKSSLVGDAINIPSGETISSGISIANPYLRAEQEQISPSSIYESLTSHELYPELFGHIVEVQIPNPDPNSTFFLSVHGKQSALYTDMPDAEGRLVYDIGGLKNWDRMIIQLENGAEMPGIQVVSPLIQTAFRRDFQFPALKISEDDLPTLEKLIKASQVEAYFKEIYDLDSMEIVTGFVADYSYNLDDYTRFEDIETVLREYVPSVLVRNRDRRKEFRLLDQAGRRQFESNPLILVDAMPVFDSDLLAKFNPKFMQRLEVLNREFYLNERTYPGVLSLSSYENNFGLFPLAPSARFFDYLGLQPLVEMDRSQFSRPVEGEKFPDWRTVLFWQKEVGSIPQVKTSELDGLYVFWVRAKDSEGKIQVRRTYLEVKP